MDKFRETVWLSVGLNFFVAAALILTVGCHSTGEGQVDAAGLCAAEEKVRQLDADWVKAGAARNVDAWVAFYADDAVVLPPNEKIATDKASIRTSVAGLLGLPGLSLSWTPTKVEVAGSGDLAYLYGAYALTANDPSGKPFKDSGKNVEIWKKQANGEWKCIVDMWNSDLPAAPAS